MKKLLCLLAVLVGLVILLLADLVTGGDAGEPLAAIEQPPSATTPRRPGPANREIQRVIRRGATE